MCVPMSARGDTIGLLYLMFVAGVELDLNLLSAVRMLDSGFASAEDIDNGMILGCAHPLGPLQLADLIGLDTIKAIAEAMYEEFKEPLYSPVPFLLRMVDAGLLGKKSGRGFYDYAGSANGAAPVPAAASAASSGGSRAAPTGARRGRIRRRRGYSPAHGCRRAPARRRP